MARRPPNILIFRIGQLGDILVSVPALRAVREHFPQARITLLADSHAGKAYVPAADVLRGSSLVQNFMTFPVWSDGTGPVAKCRGLLRLLGDVRVRRFDYLIYLAPSSRSALQVWRDRAFFRLAGIRGIIGAGCSGGDNPGHMQEGDRLLARLAADGIPVPAPGRGRVDIETGALEREQVQQWRASLPSDGGRRWIAVGPGSKMPAKVWPAERFAAVVQQLIAAFDIWPVVFGGPEDAECADRLIAQWRRGYCAAGRLTVRASVAALGRCALYLGNDTGTMHMAAAAGVRCVGIYSARDFSGKWNPYGEGHTVFRAAVPCEGCMLEECREQNMQCIRTIEAGPVQEACTRILRGV